ncbi:hypothetical protein ACGF8D_10520 [Streptomyces massasporeus]|uniref:hypothetical protein n=1 Tax=Streptomyces massasporeus TaxID=67324 RepID=UPI00371A4256
MPEYVVFVHETHYYQVTVTAENEIQAKRQAEAERDQGRGKRTSRKPERAMPMACKIKN